MEIGSRGLSAEQIKSLGQRGKVGGDEKESTMGHIRPVSIPFTATSDTTLSAFFSVSFVTSMGPFSCLAVVEKHAGRRAAAAAVFRNGTAANFTDGALRVRTGMALQVQTPSQSKGNE